MFKVVAGLLVVLGLWVAVEVMTEGSSNAFGGIFESFVSEPANTGTERIEPRSTARRAGDSATRSRDEVEARRERMLSQ